MQAVAVQQAALINQLVNLSSLGSAYLMLIRKARPVTLHAAGVPLAAVAARG